MDDVTGLLPADWHIDPETGALDVPPGTPLALKTRVQALPGGLSMPELPDLHTGPGLGGSTGSGQASIIEGLDSAAQLSVAQTGIDDPIGPFGPGMVLDQDRGADGTWE